MKAVYLAPSSANFDSYEPFIAALKNDYELIFINSFEKRGIENTENDQSLLTDWDVERDAYSLLIEHGHKYEKNFILGVSKGGSVAMNSALNIRRSWASVPNDIKFDGHVCISPDCNWVNNNVETTKKPMLFLMGELDNQTPVKETLSYIRKLEKHNNRKYKFVVIRGVHHYWHSTTDGEIYYQPEAENYSKCHIVMDDYCNSYDVESGEKLPNDWHYWALKNCVTKGTISGGGTQIALDITLLEITNFLREI